MKILVTALGAAAALMFVSVPAAQASTNLIPNPGFEQGGCGTSTPVICGWRSDSSMSQQTSNPRSGSASMHLECGAGGCYYDPDSGWGSIAADATSCVAIGPGAHAASFWYRDAVGAQVSLDATFYYDNGCTNELGPEVRQDSLAEPWPTGVGWQQVSGFLHAPTYTHSARFALSIGGWCGASCPVLAANFDDVNVADVGDPTPSIASFTPTSGWFGTRVWIYGFDFVGATSVTFNGVPAQFSVGSDQFIDASVPSGATMGPISVTTANGTGWSSSSFTLVPPPTISSFTPTGGPFGTVVDIRGSDFSGALWVQFNQHNATSFTVDSDTEIHATVGDGATTGPIAVATVSGTGYSSSSFTVPTPTITSFTPMSGPAGTSVDIRGTNFTGATFVTFNGVLATFMVDSDSELHATVPSGGRTGPISVATPAGSALSSSSFAVAGGAPTITSFTPMSGRVGTSVDIRGANLTGATSLTFGSKAATFTVDSDSELHATVPSGAINSYISVVTPVGSITAGSLFLVTASAPTITSFTPSSGPVGTSVDIQGSGLTGATSVNFAGTAAAYTVDSDSEIRATVPSGATTGPISVTTASGTGTSSASFSVKLNAPPSAGFTFSCSVLTCSFDGSGSVDPDGSITTYVWDFGDGSRASGKTVSHVYAKSGSYTVTLTVTDNSGATATVSSAVNPISLSARGYKQGGQQKVDLSWNGVAGATFDVFRNGVKIVTVSTIVYTDTLGRGAGSYTYKVCAVATATCSNDVTVSS